MALRIVPAKTPAWVCLPAGGYLMPGPTFTKVPIIEWRVNDGYPPVPITALGPISADEEWILFSGNTYTRMPSGEGIDWNTGLRQWFEERRAYSPREGRDSHA